MPLDGIEDTDRPGNAPLRPNAWTRAAACLLALASGAEELDQVGNGFAACGP